jgi:hypothetical protein
MRFNCQLIERDHKALAAHGCPARGSSRRLTGSLKEGTVSAKGAKLMGRLTYMLGCTKEYFVG